MMEFIDSILHSSNIPILTAFLLGLLTAISPCPLATNITAIGFLSKDIENKRKVFLGGIYYTLGRIVVYTFLTIILVAIIKQGASIYTIKKFLANYAGILIPPSLILIGLFMMFYEKLSFLPNLGINPSQDKLSKKGGFGAFWLGILFSLCFCPSSSIFYFTGLIPMAVVQPAGYLLAIVFAIGTGLPVVIVAWILAYSVSSVGKFYNNMKTFEKAVRYVVSSVFILVGIYYAYLYF
ncbi:MAG: cytochrome c biosis protein [Bacteroidetes bacterium]|nr:cytochrome c biosis protein [Bacteroidota bacterium]